MEHALRREVYEETGLSIYDIELISLQESISSKQFQEDRHFIFMDFLCKTDSSVLKLNNEADSYIWVKPEKILNYDLGGYCREFFEQFVKKTKTYSREIYFQYACGN